MRSENLSLKGTESRPIAFGGAEVGGVKFEGMMIWRKEKSTSISLDVLDPAHGVSAANARDGKGRSDLW